jgi:predicted nucleic acid-binding protein
VNPALVIDSSVTVAWCFKDERTSAIDAIQDRLAIETAIVPEHWCLEVANALLVGERRNRIVPTDVAQFLRELDNLLIQVDDQLRMCVFDHIIPLSRTHSLTTYDAAYLDLALRTHLPLASLDVDLRRAAATLGVQLLGMQA